MIGVGLSIKRGTSKLTLWLKDASKTEACRSIGVQLKQILSIPETSLIEFRSHESAMKGGKLDPSLTL